MTGIAPYLEALVYVILAIGGGGLLFVIVRGVLWIGDLFETRRLYPSTHIAGDDDEDLDFEEALNSLDRWDRR